MCDVQTGQLRLAKIADLLYRTGMSDHFPQVEVDSYPATCSRSRA
jgi:hypothetical protein